MQCPAAFIPSDIWRWLDDVKLAEGGMWPVAGGSHDQTQWMRSLVLFVRDERRLNGLDQ